MNNIRVVVTGVSAITPLGRNVDISWQRLINGESGISYISRFDCSKYETKIAGEIKDFNPEQFIPKKQIKRMDRFNQYAVAAAKMLLKDANFLVDDHNSSDIGIVLGCGLGGIETIEEFHEKLLRKGPSRYPHFTFQSSLPILLQDRLLYLPRPRAQIWSPHLHVPLDVTA